jgi:hypothetical protein
MSKILLYEEDELLNLVVANVSERTGVDPSLLTARFGSAACVHVEHKEGGELVAIAPRR